MGQRVVKLCLMWNDAVSSCTPSYGGEEGYWVLLAGGESWLHPYVATRPPNFPPSRSYSGRIILMRHRIQGQSDWEVPRNRHREDCTSWCGPGRKDKARHYRRHGVQVTHSCVHGRWGHVSEIDIFLRQHQATANQLHTHTHTHTHLNYLSHIKIFLLDENKRDRERRGRGDHLDYQMSTPQSCPQKPHNKHSQSSQSQAW